MTAESEILTPVVPGSHGVDTLVLPVGVIWGRVGRASGDVRHPVVIARDGSGRRILAEWTDEYGYFRVVGVAGAGASVTFQDAQSGERDSAWVDVDPTVPASLFVFLGPAPE